MLFSQWLPGDFWDLALTLRCLHQIFLNGSHALVLWQILSIHRDWDAPQYYISFLNNCFCRQASEKREVVPVILTLWEEPHANLIEQNTSKHHQNIINHTSGSFMASLAFGTFWPHEEVTGTRESLGSDVSDRLGEAVEAGDWGADGRSKLSDAISHPGPHSSGRCWQPGCQWGVRMWL